MSSFLFPISYAFLTFPVAALLFNLPFLVVQYRKHGYINKIRAVILYLFLLYLMNAVYLVVLPFPASRHNLALAGGSVQAVPFHFIKDIMKETLVQPDKPSTYWHLFVERAFLQVVFNVALTVPYGMILRYYFRTRWIRCSLLSFLLSLLFEVTQLTGIYGYYDHPYRVFDVDDLITNTLGGVVGFLLAHWLTRFLPQTANLDRNVDIAAKRVSYTRRGVALFFDFFAWQLVLAALFALHLHGPSAYVVSTGLYFMLLPWITGGRTLGKWLVRIHLERVGGRLSLLSLVLRYGILYWLLAGLNLLFLRAFTEMHAVGRVAGGLGLFLMDACFLLHLIQHLIGRNPVLFYEKISRTAHKITWHPEKNPPVQGGRNQTEPDGDSNPADPV